MDNSTLGMLKDSTDLSGISDSAKQGVQLASAYQNVQAQKQTMEQQQTQISEAKFNGAMGAISTYGKMSPEMQSKFRPMIEKQVSGYGLDAYAPILDNMDSDPVLKAGMASLAGDSDFLKNSGLNLDSINSQLAANPLAATDQMHSLLQARADYYKNKAVAQNNIEVAKAKANATGDQNIKKQQLVNDGKQEVADTVGGVKLDKQASAEYKRISTDKTVKARLDNLDSLDKAQELFKTYENYPKGIPITVFRDMNNDLSTALRLKGVGGVDERSRTELENVNTKIADLVQHWDPTGGIAYVNDKDLIDSAKKTIGVVREGFGANAINAAKSLYRNSKIQSVNDSQAQAIEQLKDRVAGNTNTYDAAMSMSGAGVAPGQQPMQSPAPTAAPTPPPVAPGQQAVPLAQAPIVTIPKTAAEAMQIFKGKFSDDQIKNYIAKKGLK